MPVPRDEHERTLVFAEIALGQIKALSQAATPRNFEIWYNYATGYNPEFNKSLNEALAKNGTLSERDLAEIYSTYLAPNRAEERIETVGARVTDEIKQVLDMMDAAAGSATSYSEDLANANQKLAGAIDAETVREIIGRLADGAKEMEANNKKLEARLSASKQEIEQLQHNLDAVRNESRSDPLTTLSNRKFFDVEFAKTAIEAKNKNEPLSLLMGDVDHFKSFNDKFGHQTGDQVLRLVAMAIKQNVKGQDIAARYGGEEFVVALPHTMMQSALTVADRIRRAVMAKELMKRSTGERLGRVTLSIGVASLHPTDTPQLLIERADKCLYAAKRAGRNRVVCEDELDAAGGGKVAAKVA